MKRSDPQPLHKILSQLITERNFDTKINELRLLDAWERVMGEHVQRYTREKSIRYRTLYIHLTSSVLRNELLMCRSELVARLNQAVGASVIDTIVFR